MPAIFLKLISIFVLVSSVCAGQAREKEGNRFASTRGLVMAGYQGWFTAEGDGAERGWHHYQKQGKFEPGFASIDFWPDVADYAKTYNTSFSYSNGETAKTYSSFDEESVDLHFKWMKQYGIDGVYMQRFVSEIKSERGKRHFNKVLGNALKAAKKYGRAIAIMYDLSGSKSADMDFIASDWEALQKTFALFDKNKNPTYLHHNGHPLLAIWGVGFNDGRRYTIGDVDNLVEKVKGTPHRTSLLLGVPYYWRTLDKDTENSELLHTLIKKVDVIMPWAVGRYNGSSYDNVSGNTLAADIAWCRSNHVDYIPLVFPGFSWGNLKNDKTLYNQIPRDKGSFLWQQIAGAKAAGANALYVAMFDEVDEGTAIFKTRKEGETPLNGDGKFVGTEPELATDYYLWLVGEGAKWFHGAKEHSPVKPVRK